MGSNKHNKNTAGAASGWNLLSYYLYFKKLENVLRLLESSVKQSQMYQVLMIRSNYL